jgi:hypothetical protein
MTFLIVTFLVLRWWDKRNGVPASPRDRFEE